jgi:NitT/TauT family transport system substrate-binding protein
VAGINTKLRGYPQVKDCFPWEDGAVIQTNSQTCRQTIVTLSLAIICLSLVFTTIASANAITGEPIKLGLNVWVTNFLPYIAQEKGFFEKNNVNVQLTLVPDYLQMIDGYYAGQFDGIMGVYADVIFQNSQGTDSKVVFAVDYSETADAIVGKQNGNITTVNFTNNSLAEVQGKKIGVQGINSFSHLFTLKALEKAGLNEGDVEFVDVPAQNVTHALEKGEIVAGHTYEPYTSEALKKGYKILFTAGSIPGIINTVLAFRSGVIEQRPTDIQAIVKSLVEAEDYYKNNKMDALKIMSSKSGIPESDIVSGFDGIHVLSLSDNINTAMNIQSNDTASLYVTGKEISTFFVNRGQISDLPDIAKIIDPVFAEVLFKSDKR